jgi:hypothetical protein
LSHPLQIFDEIAPPATAFNSRHIKFPHTTQ